MAKLPTLILPLLATAAAAADRVELPLTVLAGGISKEPRPALAIGAFAGGFGIHDAPDPTHAQWLPEIRRTDASVSAMFGELAPPAAEVPLLVIAALPMPWRPTAIERRGTTIVIDGDGVEPADATPELTGEPAAALGATHDFALMVPRAGVETVRLEVVRHAKVDGQAWLRAVGPVEAVVDLAKGPTKAEARAASEVISAPGAWFWEPPRVIEGLSEGGDHEEGLVGVGRIDAITETKMRPPLVHPPAPGDQLTAVVVTPVLQTGEWAQLRSVGWFTGTCHLTVAVFHDRGDRDKNVPHRDALIVPINAVAKPMLGDGTEVPPVVVHFETYLAARMGGDYVRQKDQ
jgi:hypothetical protein